MSDNLPNPQTSLAVLYFDGKTAQANPAQLSVQGQMLLVHSADGELRHQQALGGLHWPEAILHTRMLTLSNGGQVQGIDTPAWDGFVRNVVGQRPGWVQRLQVRWQAALAAVVVLAAGGVAGYVWGIPAAARASLSLISPEAERRMGEEALAQFERLACKPSKLSPEQRTHWQTKISAAVKSAYPKGNAPAYELTFCKLGAPNALAMPGGFVVLSDELVRMAERYPQVADSMVIGVFGHELGHVRHRHGMQHLVSTSLVGAVSAFMLGDVSGFAATAATALGQASYSRDKEREADAFGRMFLYANGMNGLGMVKFFSSVHQERLEAQTSRCLDEATERVRRRALSEGLTTPPSAEEVQAEAKACVQAVADSKRREPSESIGAGFAGHPADAERISFFEQAVVAAPMP